MSFARAAHAAQRLACLAIVATLVAGSVSRAWAAETTLPEEALYQRLVIQGDLDGARAGFAALIDARLAALASAPSPSGPGVDDASVRRAGLVDVTVRAIRLWETGEVRLRMSGTPTPDAVLEKIAGALDALAPYAATLPAPAALDAGGQSVDAPRVRQANDHAGELFLLSTAFFRDTKLAKRRADLLASARRHVAAPATLAALDAQKPQSASEAFGFGPPAAPAPRAAVTPPPGPRPLRDDEQGVAALVQAYCRAFVAGDMAALRPLFVAGRFPKRAVAREAPKFAGWQLTRVGDILVRDLGPDELEVTISEITLAGPGGETRRTRDRVIVRRTAPGEYRIASLGGGS